MSRYLRRAPHGARAFARESGTTRDGARRFRNLCFRERVPSSSSATSSPPLEVALPSAARCTLPERADALPEHATCYAEHAPFAGPYTVRSTVRGRRFPGRIGPACGPFTGTVDGHARAHVRADAPRISHRGATFSGSSATGSPSQVSGEAPAGLGSGPRRPLFFGRKDAETFRPVGCNGPQPGVTGAELARACDSGCLALTAPPWSPLVSGGPRLGNTHWGPSDGIHSSGRLDV